MNSNHGQVELGPGTRLSNEDIAWQETGKRKSLNIERYLFYIGRHTIVMGKQQKPCKYLCRHNFRKTHYWILITRFEIKHHIRLLQKQSTIIIFVRRSYYPFRLWQMPFIHSKTDQSHTRQCHDPTQIAVTRQREKKTTHTATLPNYFPHNIINSLCQTNWTYAPTRPHTNHTRGVSAIRKFHPSAPLISRSRNGDLVQPGPRGWDNYEQIFWNLWRSLDCVFSTQSSCKQV